MKNKMKIFTIGLLTLCSSVLSAYAINGFQNQNRDDLIVSTEDVFNEKQNIAKYGIRRAASNQNLDCSKIYAQYGFDGTNYYLRFATAVKGDLDDIKYTAKFVDSDVDIIEKNVYTVYKGIASEAEVNYYNGNSLVDVNLASTKDYYWACLTIKFNEDSENMTRDIKVDIDVNNGAHADTRTTSLDALLNGSEEEEEGETRKMTLGEYVLDQGTSPLFTFEKLESNLVAPSDSSNYPCNIAQGSCTDGEYLYIAMNSSESTSTYKNQFGKVIKYDINKQEVTDYTDIIGTAGKNDATGPGNANLFYNPIDKQIYLLGGTRSGGAGGLCSDWRINPETMEVTKLGEILNTDGFNFELPDAQTYFSKWASNAITYDVENLEYNSTLQKWAVVFRVKSGGTDIKDGTKSVFRRLFFYDKDLKLSDGVQNIIVNNSVTTNTGYGIQEMTSDEKYIYIDYTAWPAKNTSIIRMFSWEDGTEHSEITINGSNFSDAGSSNYNVQFVQPINNDLYIGSYQSLPTAGLHLSKATHEGMISSGATTPQTPTKLNFGEAMEYASITNQNAPLTGVKELSKLTVSGILPVYNGTEEGITMTLGSNSYRASKGATTDGEYIYQVLYPNADGAAGCDTGIIAKFSLDGEFKGSTKYSYHWGNNARLGYADGKIFVGRTSGCHTPSANWGCGNATTYNKDTLVFDTNLNLLDDHYESECGTPVLNGVNGYIDMVSGSKDGRKIAYVYTWSVNGSNQRKLYTYEKNSDGTYTTLVNGIELPSAKASNSKTGAITGMYANDSYLYLIYNIATMPVIRVLDWNGNELATKEFTGAGNAYTGIFEINNELYCSNYVWSGESFGCYIYHIDYSVNTNTNLKKVSYNTNGAQRMNDIFVEVGGTVPRPVEPKHSYTDSNGKTYNFVLENWYNGEKIWDFENDVVTDDIVLTAKWTFEDSFFEIKENANVRTENTTARVMSFNVLSDDWNNKPAVDDTRANQAFDTIERYAPDVVGLQEFDDEWYAKSKTLLNGYKLVNIDNNKINGVTNYTTLAYNTSTVKLVAFDQKALTTNYNKNCRNVTMGLFEFITGENVGKQFIVTSTHWELDENSRVKNAKETAQFLKEWEAQYPNVPIIATGDYNAYDDQQAAPTFLSESGYLDTKNAKTTGIVCKTTHIGNGMIVGDKDQNNPEHWLRGPISFLPAHIEQTTCIDHIYTTTNVTALYYDTIVDSDALSASDHCPIYCDLQF